MHLILSALTPFILLFGLMAVFKKPAIIAAPITLLVTAVLAFSVWDVSPNWLAAGVVRGALVSVDIVLIILGAMVLLSTLKEAGLIDSIEAALARVSPDKRIQAILVAWFFVAFIEGAAGFGAPAMLAAPLLVALGFSPLAAVVMALVGDSLAVTFGAVGVPITIGIAEGVGLAGAGLTELPRQVAIITSLIYLAIGFLVPLMISVLAAKFSGHTTRKGLEVWPFALLSAFLFLIPFVLSAVFLPLEFPSMIGGLVGGALAVTAVRYKILQPEVKLIFGRRAEQPSARPSMSGFLPYMVILVLLATTRLNIAGLKEWLTGFNIEVNGILGTTLSYSLAILYSPAFVFLLVAAVTAFVWKTPLSGLILSFVDSVKKIMLPLLTLVAVLGIVQILIASGHNGSGLPAMPMYLAQHVDNTGAFWLLISPFVGALGAFMAGSSTVSNLLFSSFQAQTALNLGLDLILVLALQAAGSAIGNMVAIHNIVAAQASVGLKHQEGHVLRVTIVPAVMLLVLSGLLALILYWLK